MEATSPGLAELRSLLILIHTIKTEDLFRKEPVLFPRVYALSYSWVYVYDVVRIAYWSLDERCLATAYLRQLSVIKRGINYGHTAP